MASPSPVVTVRSAGMKLWTLSGLFRGNASTKWGVQDGDDGQTGVLGMPRFNPALCTPDCTACATSCPTGAISLTPQAQHPIGLDYGKCVTCQLCVEACPTGALTPSQDWAFGVRQREDLLHKKVIRHQQVFGVVYMFGILMRAPVMGASLSFKP